MKCYAEAGYMRLLLPLLLLGLAIALSSPAHGKTRQDPVIKEMQQIVERTDIDNAAKIQRLQTYIKQGRCVMTALSCMARVDQTAARDAGIGLFRDKTATQFTKFVIGHFLLTRVDPGAFLNEYAQFLVPAVLAGEEEFMRVHDDGTYTAVGEYANIAANFNGYKPAIFDAMQDARTIPILIRCLNAPDDVWPQHQGDCIRGKPGTSTGRNIARQNIPLALARLHATEAIPALQAIQRTHKDMYLRKNAEEALAVLTKKP